MTVQTPPLRKPFQWASLFYFIIAVLGIIINLTGAGIWFLAGGVTLVSQGAQGTVLQYFQLGWTALAVCLFLLPSAGLSLSRLARWNIHLPAIKRSLLISTIALFLVPVLLWVGGLIVRQPGISWIILPPVQILVVIIPLWWFIEMGRWGLRAVSSHESWGILSFGLVVTPVLVVVVELVLIAFLGIGMLLWLSSVPGWAEELTRLVQRLSVSQMDVETMMRILRPLISQPWVLVVSGVIIAGIIPLLEELLKPLALWGIATQKLSLGQGFILGLICGAAFAFWESSNNLSVANAADWVTLATGRIGTGLLHTVNAGIVGWGLAAAWGKRKYVWMVGAFLLAVMTHGAWNFLVLLDANADTVGYSSLILTQTIPTLSSWFTIGLILLVVFLLSLLVGTNLLLRRSEKRSLSVTVEPAGNLYIDGNSEN